MTDEYQIDNVTWAEEDGNGNIVVKPDLVNAGEINNTVRVAEDDDLQAAIDAATDGDTIVIENGPNGRHDVDSTVVCDTRLHFVWRNTLVPTGDFRTFVATDLVTIDPSERIPLAEDLDNNTSSSTDGVVFKARFFVNGVARVADFGRDNIVLEQDDTEGTDNLNHSVWYFRTRLAGRHGLRIVNIGGSAVNLNGMDGYVHASNNGDMGVYAPDGKRNELFLNCQNNTGQAWQTEGMRNILTIDEEANGSAGQSQGDECAINVLNSQRSGIGGHAADGTNGSVVKQGSTHSIAESAHSPVLTLENILASNSGRSANLRFANDSGLVARIRARGDGVFGVYMDSASDFEVLNSDGGGVVTTTPDGTARYRIRVDNSGNVVTDQL